MPRFTANLSLLFTEYPLLERFQAARSAGFEAVEIQFPYAQSAAQIRQAAEAAGTPIILFNVPVADFMQGGNGLACVPGQEEAFAQALEHALEYARDLQPRCINVLAGRVPEGISRDEALTVYTGNLRLAAEAMARRDIACVFEAINSIDVPGYPVNTLAHSRDVLLAVNHPNLSLQFDIYHMTRMQEDLIQGLSEMIGQIGHIQFADVPGRGEPGSGEIDFDALFRHIDTLDYDGWLGAEYNPTTATADSLCWLPRP